MKQIDEVIDSHGVWPIYIFVKKYGANILQYSPKLKQRINFETYPVE